MEKIKKYLVFSAVTQTQYLLGLRRLNIRRKLASMNRALNYQGQVIKRLLGFLIKGVNYA